MYRDFVGFRASQNWNTVLGVPVMRSIVFGVLCVRPAPTESQPAAEKSAGSAATAEATLPLWEALCKAASSSPSDQSRAAAPARGERPEADYRAPGT